jgi:PAS domain S-box-containing protein
MSSRNTPVSGEGRDRSVGGARAVETEVKRLRRQLAETEARLASAEGRLAAVLDELVDGIVLDRAIRDEAGRIVDFQVEYANEAACRLSGLTHDEMVGHRLLDLFPGRREDGLFDACVRVVETGEPLARNSVRRYDTAARSDNEGHGGSYEISAAKLGDGCVATLHDIAARVHAEEELARSQQFLRVVLDTIPLRVFWKDRDGVYLGCNRAFLNESSMTEPDQIVGKTDFELDWRDRAEQFREEDRVVLDSGRPQLGFEKPELHNDGRQTLVRMNKAPLFDEDGNVSGLLGTIEDLTDHLRTEKALKDSEAFLASILENIPSMLYVKDAKTLTFVRVNRATELTLGYTADQLTAGSWAHPTNRTTSPRWTSRLSTRVG